MARMYPPTEPHDCESAAERLLYREFERQLSDDFVVMHSVAWRGVQYGKVRDGEADFVLLHPRLGVLVLEVKGGTIRRDGSTGQWFSTSRAGDQWKINDPFEQAKRSMYQLRDLVRTLPSTEVSGCHPARGVVFPDITCDGVDFGPSVPPELIADSTDLGDLERAVNRVWKSGTPGKLTSNGIEDLINSLSPTVEANRIGLQGSILREHQEFVRLTQRQIEVLDFIRRHSRVAIRGTAGSGKTLLAIETVRRLARQQFRVLYTCFNRALAAEVRETLQESLGDDMVNVIAMNYHDLAEDFVRRSGKPLPTQAKIDSDPAFARQYYQHDLSDMLDESLKLVDDRFDAIVVDEGQDFADAWWVMVESLFADPDQGVFFIFYDDNQLIFEDRDEGYPIPEPHFDLGSNCRTTQEIHRLAAAYAAEPFAHECGGPEGRSPEVVPVTGNDVAGALRRVLHRLVNSEGIPVSDIVVLSPRSSRSSALAEGLKLGNFTLSWEPIDPDAVRIRSIHGFKGLESPVVILVELDTIKRSNPDAIIHTAITRAMHHLVVIGELPWPTANTVD